MSLPDPIKAALPIFIVLMIVEVVVSRRRSPHAYELRDTVASLAMGFGNLGQGGALRFLGAGSSAFLYKYRLFDIGFGWWAFVLIFFFDDLVYYWFHRFSHEVRIWWAAHVNHHSSQHYNLSTAFRQTWTNNLVGTFLLWSTLALIGFPPALIAFQKAASMVYGFWVHTEQVGKMPRWYEAVFVTPSHHRVHHATNPKYLDRNYGGNLILWDKLFGTFVAEDPSEPCRYGIVKNIGTFNPLRIAFHEWVSIARDVVRARSLREVFGYVFGPPGWKPDGLGLTAARIRREWDAPKRPASAAADAAAE